MRWSPILFVAGLAVLARVAPAQQPGPPSDASTTTAGQDRPTLGITIAALPQEKGVRVLDILPNSPAAQAGVRSGDTILVVDGTVVNSPEDLSNVVNQKKPNDHVELRFTRDGKPQTVTVKLVSRRSLLGAEDRELRHGTGSRPIPAAHAWLGVLLGDEGPNKVVVRRILPGGPAARAGLERGDVLLSVDGKKVASRRDVIDALRQKEPNSQVKLDIRRDGKEQTIEARLGAQERFGMGLLPLPMEPGRIERGQEPGEEETPAAAERIEKSVHDLIGEIRDLRREVGELRRERNRPEPAPPPNAPQQP